MSPRRTPSRPPGPRRQRTVGSWFQNQLWNTSLVWLVALGVGGMAFYFTVNFKLDAHDKAFLEIKSNSDLAFKELKEALSKQGDALKETKRTENAEREKVRSEFIADSKATAAGIAELNKQSAVTAAVIVSVKDELVKMNQRLDNMPPTGKR